jgi:hypothetical protein
LENKLTRNAIFFLLFTLIFSILVAAVSANPYPEGYRTEVIGTTIILSFLIVAILSVMYLAIRRIRKPHNKGGKQQTGNSTSKTLLKINACIFLLVGSWSLFLAILNFNGFLTYFVFSFLIAVFSFTIAALSLKAKTTKHKTP